MRFMTAYDIIAHILGLQPENGKSEIYIKKGSGKRYRRTKWGFEPVEKHNLRIDALRLGHKLDRLKSENEELKYQNESLIRKTEGLRKQLALCQENGKKLKKEKGFINKLLKEVLDKNLSLDKKYDRLLKSKESTEKQLENLKLSKANLLEQYNALIEKNRDQKKHLQEFQKVIADLKKK
jgi:chromosome segregation ATPase